MGMNLEDWLDGFSPIEQALVAGMFTWFMTAFGAGLVFFFHEINRKALDGMLGFAAGVMIAASCFGLLGPAIDQTQGEGVRKVLPAAFGFIFGGVCMRVIDAFLPHLHPGAPPEEVEGVKTSWHRSKLLISAITLHNIPEGLAIGVAFGAASSGDGIGAAVALSIGIGIQNFPEGAAVSVPLRREGLTKKESFWWGQLSAMVEPLAAVLGAATIVFIDPILPYALAFAAGAMIFVVVEELIPEAHRGKNGDIATMGVMVGFTIMMILDVALG